MAEVGVNAPLDGARLEALAAGQEYVGSKILVLEETTSTNDECHRRASDVASDGFAVFAEAQNAGRGQQGKIWSTPPRSAILMSTLLFPPQQIDSAVIIAWTAVAIAETLERCHRLAARIKWPNDILVGGRKIAGILVERRRAMVVGIGVNVNATSHDFPPTIDYPATSVRLETGEVADRTALASELLRRLDRDYAAVIASGPEALFARWRELSAVQPGELVTARTRNSTVAGRLESIDPSRGAYLTISDGSQSVVPAEELLRIERPPEA